MNVIELRDVFRVHRTAEGDAAPLQGATLSVAAGEQVCVLGPSGAGKSTLLRVVAGLEPPSAGAVRVLGRDIGRLAPHAAGALRREAIGFLDQHAEHNLPPDLPAAQAVVLALALRGVGRPGRRRRAAELLEAVGLADRAGARPVELSGGERQRLALCAALAHRPAILLADEPTGELDEDSAVAVRALIAELARAGGTTVVVVSHDGQMACHADRTVRLRDGRFAGEQAGAAATAGDGPAPGHQPVRLECRALAKAYGDRQVLAGLSVAFAPAALTVVSGRSGSGKSTLLRLLAGLEPPDAGAVLVGGRSLAGLDAEARAATRRAILGYMAQEFRLVPFLSARENVELAGELHGRGPQGAGALARLGLAERADQRVSRLSAGERQRVALARALASARGLLLVDEPTSRLDEASTALVAGALARAAAAGHTVVCATHEPALIDLAAHRLAL